MEKNIAITSGFQCRLKIAIEDNDLRQKDIEKAANLPIGAISKMIHGKRKTIRHNELLRLINAINLKWVTADYLLGIDEKTKYIEGFLSLFSTIATPAHYFDNCSGVLEEEDLGFSSDGDYVALIGNTSAIDLIKDIAEIKCLSATLLPHERKARLNAAKSKYKENRETASKDKYFLISAKELTKMVETLVQGHRAIKLVCQEPPHKKHHVKIL